MNLNLSKRGDYVVRSAICLARNFESGAPKKLRLVALEMDIPRTYVSQILGDLNRAGIAQSFFGTNGGFSLTRSPDQINLLEIVESAEGLLTSATCVLGEDPCDWESVCPLHETWKSGTAALRSVLASTTLAELLQRDIEIRAGTYVTSDDGHRQPGLSVAVSDSVQVELAAPAVAQRLRAESSWLIPHVEAAHSEEEEILVRIGPGGPGWLGKVVAVHFTTSQGPDDNLVIQVSWEATGPSGLFPRFKGELHVVAVDPTRSELNLSGRYRPPLGRAGQILDEAVLARVARATIRSLLRRMARALEEEQTT